MEPFTQVSKSRFRAKFTWLKLVTGSRWARSSTPGVASDELGEIQFTRLQG